MKRILMPRGKLLILANKVGMTTQTCSKYLRGLVDESTVTSMASIERVRNLAIELGGVMEP